MSIQSSITRTEGTSIVFKTTPTVGLLALTGFIDDEGANASSFIKVFRYTTNGITYSKWIPLTVQNIISIELVEKNIFVAEINYTKILSNISFPDVTTLTFQTIAGNQPLAGDYYKNSLFQKYFNISDVDALNWHINVLEKIYQKGLVPNYIDRLDDFGIPDDFLALWGAVSKFFSYYVELSRVISKFYNNIKLLTEFLQQRGLIVSPENTLQELQDMLETYYFQMGKRGTYGAMQGEVLRLIHFKSLVDEYLWCLLRKHHFGWNLGNSSPMYRSLRINDSLNKIPWSSKYVSVVSNETALNTYTQGAVITDAGNQVISLTAGQTIFFQDVTAVIIDPRLDYQFSFKIKLTSGNFSLDARAYNISGVSILSKSKKTGQNQNSIFTNAVLSRADRYLTVKCYLYNSNSGFSTQNHTNIRQGQNLVLNALTEKLGLILTVSGTAKIYDIRLMPMITSYSRGFLQSNNFIPMWVLNRNGDYNNRQLKDYISKYLIPYNCHTQITDIDQYSLSVIDTAPETFYWVPTGGYCRKTIWTGADPSCELQNLIWVPDESTAYCETV